MGYFIYWQLSPNPSLGGTLAIVGASSMAACITTWILIARCTNSLPADGKFPVRAALKTSIPMMLASSSRSALEVLDTVILGAFGMHQAAALYGVASRLAFLALVPTQVANSVILPEIVAQHSRNDKARLQNVLQGGSAAAFIPAALALGIFAILGKQIIGLLYRSEYLEALPILVAVALGNTISAWNASANPALILSGHQKSIMNTTACISISCLLAQLVCVKWVGPTGLAIVRALALTVLTVVVHFLCRSKLKVDSHSSIRCFLSLLAARS